MRTKNWLETRNNDMVDTFASETTDSDTKWQNNYDGFFGGGIIYNISIYILKLNIDKLFSLMFYWKNANCQ